MHAAEHSGPLRSLAPRLEELRRRGTTITTTVPGPGAAARMAAELGDVIEGVPGAVVLPRSVRAAVGVGRDLRAQRARVSQIVRERRVDLALISSLRLPGAIKGARDSGAAAALYAGDPPSERPGAVAGGHLLAAAGGRLADAVIVPSAASARWQGRLGLTAHIVPPAIEPPPADAQEAGVRLRASLGLSAEDRVLVSVGALTSERGQADLLEALARTERAEPGVSLLIAGEPYQRPVDQRFAASLRRRAAELGLERQVHFLGAVDDVAPLYAAGDVFVNPARIRESFGRAACEALLAGCAVVGTRAAAMASVLEHGVSALVVEPASPGQLASAIVRLLRDRPLAARLAAAGAAHVRSRGPMPGSDEFEAALGEALGHLGPAAYNGRGQH